MDSITLLDCNNKASSQYLGGNRKSPALFTNKLGSGIKVEAGDRVSVHNAFISEIGSDANAIQITSEFLENKTFTYTQLTYENKVNGSNEKILGYERISASNIKKTEEVYSNKFSLLINYYKNNNGENHFNLPRLFCHKSVPNPRADWEEYDAIEYGQIPGEYAISTSLSASYNGSKVSAYIVDDDMFYFGVIDRVEDKGFRPRNNNSRFKIYISDDTRYGSQTNGSLDPVWVNASFDTPALLNYLEYIEKLDIEIPVGFKGPDEIADNVTSQLRKQSQPNINYIRSNAVFDANASLSTDRHVSVEINSPTYHTFYSASPYSSNKDKFISFQQAINGSTLQINNANTYLSQYQYIGVKRPDLWERGREFAIYYKKWLNDYNENDNVKTIAGGIFNNVFALNASQFWRGTDNTERPHEIVFNIKWEKETLEKLNAIFMEQRNHSELFENKWNQLNGYTNVNNSRFLHMDALCKLEKQTLSASYRYILGNDYMLPNASGVNLLNSVPIFFDFNPIYENKYTEGNSWEEGYSFGCFKKVSLAGAPFDYVAVTTSHLGIIDDNTLNASFMTIPNNLFNLNRNGSTTNKAILSTNFGWDVHFNSYGNVCVGLTDGYVQESRTAAQINYMLPTPFSLTQEDSSQFIQKIYLGANEPLLDYNNTSNRFEISNLHTAERIQNRFNAGGIDSASKHTEQIVPEFSTAGEKVYKINKRLFDTNFTPNMMPYSANRLETLKVSGQNYQIDFLNPNLDGWTIYDQLSGIMIKDFGYSSLTWEDGFWGRLGFEYTQFNSPKTSLNDLTTRIGNDNKNTLPYAITNAEVGQVSTMDLPTNIWGAGTYSLQLPITMSFAVANTGANQSDFFRQTLTYQQFPSISETAHSVKLTAPNLPRKIINPYFCIRSDILDSSDYLGGADSGELYPVVAVVPKISDYPDFFVNTSPDMEFVFSKSKTITSITTSIHDPNQTLSQLDNDSAIIYKITRSINPNNFDIVSQILNKNKK